MLARTWALLALAPSAAALQAPDATVVFRADPLAGGSSTAPVILRSLSAGANGGWVVSGQTFGGSSARSSIYGDLGPGGSGPGQLLRDPQNLAGVEQAHLMNPSLADGRIAYVDSPTSDSLARGTSAWLDDALIARRGDAVGSTGGEWWRFDDVIQLVGGDTLVRGSMDVGPDRLGVVARYPGADVLLRGGDHVPGLAGPVRGITKFAASADGARWAALVTVDVGATLLERAIVVDGRAFAVQGGAVPPLVGSSAASYGSFSDVAVGSNGDVVILARVDEGSSARTVSVRRGRPVELAFPQAEVGVPEAVDGNGFAVQLEGSTVPAIEGVSLFGDGDVDVDGDGVVDPSADLRYSPFTQGSDSITASPVTGDVLWIAELRPGSPGDIAMAVVRMERAGNSQVYCDGVTNQTGTRARLAAFGADVASENDLALSCIDVPSGSAGLFLVSFAPGFTANPSGSFGNLCLQMPIGRYASTPFVAGDSGRAVLGLDLGAVPQPGGSVSVGAGANLYFQAWYRDRQGMQVGSNFSDAAAVRLR